MKSFMGSYTLFLHFQQFNDELQLNYSVDKFNSSFVQTILRKIVYSLTCGVYFQYCILFPKYFKSQKLQYSEITPEVSSSLETRH